MVLKDGVKVQFKDWKGELVTDTVRGEVFQHYVLVEPYARNYTVPGVVLTNYSWIRVSKVLAVLE